jgi:hypothetical protein
MIYLPNRYNITKIFVLSKEQAIYKNKQVNLNFFISDVLKEKNKFKNSRDL